jgi:exo-beta-1,3-glucanase (GH17 family)
MPASLPPPRGTRIFAWIVLVLVVLAAAGYWWQLGRPVAMPDAPSARVSCVSYAPFRLPGESPLNTDAFVSPERIDADLKALSTRFDCVRTYAMNQGLDAVPAIAARHGMKVIMGIWLGRNQLYNEKELAAGIAAAKAHPEALRSIVVGNEVMLRGELSETALAGYIERVRAATSVPVTYADVWEFWLRYKKLANSVSYITVHILPYWEDEPVPPQTAVAHVTQVYKQIKAAFPGRQVMIGETGWPSAGRPRHGTSATLVNEARYVREFLDYAATVDMPYNMIEAFDQPWKRDLEGTPGGYWGLSTVDNLPKFPMLGPVVEEPRWWLGWAAGAVMAVLTLLTGCWRRDWRGGRGTLVLLLTGFASGAALANHARLLHFACRDPLEWTIGTAVGLFALLTMLVVARALAHALDGQAPRSVQAVAGWRAGLSWPGNLPALRFCWLFLLALYGLLLVFNGRYRDFPVGVFAMPAIGFALLALLRERASLQAPILEERLLALLVPVLGVLVAGQEAFINPTAWLWAGVNVLVAIAVLRAWRGGRLQPYQPQAANK